MFYLINYLEPFFVVTQHSCVEELLNYILFGGVVMNILECSSKGDKRFSAFYAKVSVFNKFDSIENHYQLSKRFGDKPAPLTWREAKGKKPTHFVVGNKEYPLNLLAPWYESLWLKYFSKNIDLLKVIEFYDDFTDMFKRKNAVVCQADVIKKIRYKGLSACIKENEFLNLLNKELA
jgi:hypothetical protein